MDETEDFQRQIGRRIAALREALELTQQALAERAGISTSYVAHIETGTSNPTLAVLRDVAGAVNVPVWRLVADDRLTIDEKAWDAASRELAASVRGLPPSDLQVLSYLARRLGTAERPARILRAAEPGARYTPSRKHAKRRR